MTRALSDILHQVSKLSKERQNDAVQILLTMIENDARPYQLTEQQLEEVDAAMADVATGEFASSDDVREALHRAWA